MTGPSRGKGSGVSWLDGLDDRERRVLGECLVAVLDGPFLDDDFETVMGMERSTVRAVLTRWPDPDEPREQEWAVGAALNNLLRYPHGGEGVWADWLSVNRDELHAIEYHVDELTGQNDVFRARVAERLRDQVESLEAGDPHNLWGARDDIARAERLGVTVPDRLVRALAGDDTAARDRIRAHLSKVLRRLRVARRFELRMQAPYVEGIVHLADRYGVQVPNRVRKTLRQPDH